MAGIFFAGYLISPKKPNQMRLFYEDQLEIPSLFSQVREFSKIVPLEEGILILNKIYEYLNFW